MVRTYTAQVRLYVGLEKKTKKWIQVKWNEKETQLTGTWPDHYNHATIWSKTNNFAGLKWNLKV